MFAFQALFFCAFGSSSLHGVALQVLTPNDIEPLPTLSLTDLRKRWPYVHRRRATSGKAQNISKAGTGRLRYIAVKLEKDKRSLDSMDIEKALSATPADASLLDSATESKKVAFMFMLMDELDWPKVWDRFFADAKKHRYSIYIHRANATSSSKDLKLVSHWGATVVPRVENSWCALMGVEVALIIAALQDPLNAQFVLVSHDSIPLKAFGYIYKQLAIKSPDDSKFCLADRAKKGRGYVKADKAKGNAKQSGLPPREPVVRGELSTGGFLFSYDRPDMHVVPISREVKPIALKTMSERLAEQDLCFCSAEKKAQCTAGKTDLTTSEIPFKTFLSLEPMSCAVDELKHQYAEHHPPLRTVGSSLVSPRYPRAFQTGAIHNDVPLNQPLEKSTALAWAGCSNGARLAYANTAVQHKKAPDPACFRQLGREVALNSFAKISRASSKEVRARFNSASSSASCGGSAASDEKASASGRMSRFNSASSSASCGGPAGGDEKAARHSAMSVAEGCPLLDELAPSAAPPKLPPWEQAGHYQRWRNCVAVAPSEAWLDLHISGSFQSIALPTI